MSLDLAPGSLIFFCGYGQTCVKIAGFAAEKAKQNCIVFK